MNTFAEIRLSQQLKNGTRIGADRSAAALVDGAKEIGQGSTLLDGPSSNHQLRKFYDAVKQIERRTVRWKNYNESIGKDLVAQLLFLASTSRQCQRK